MKKWYRQKTFWAGVGMIVNGIWPAFTADGFIIALISTEMVLGGLGLIFLRQSVENK